MNRGLALGGILRWPHIRFSDLRHAQAANPVQSYGSRVSCRHLSLPANVLASLKAGSLRVVLAYTQSRCHRSFPLLPSPYGLGNSFKEQ